MSVNLGARQRFCHQICRVLGAQDLVQAAFLRPDKVLDPQLRHRQVSDLADATPASDSYSGGGICVHLWLQFNPEVTCNALQA